MMIKTPFGIRLEAGAQLPESIERVASRLGIHFCDVDGFGVLEWVVIAAAGRESRRVQGPLQLLSLKGRLRKAGDVVLSDYVCTVARDTDDGAHILGGRLVAGSVSFLEVSVIPLALIDEAATRSPADGQPTTGGSDQLPIDRSGSSDAPMVSSAQLSPEDSRRAKWDHAVLQAKRIQDDGDFLADQDSDARPSRGDIVIHTQFGECKVTRITDDHITLRKPDGRNVQLGLSILSFALEGRRDGRDAYRVAVRSKR